MPFAIPKYPQNDEMAEEGPSTVLVMPLPDMRCVCALLVDASAVTAPHAPVLAPQVGTGAGVIGMTGGAVHGMTGGNVTGMLGHMTQGAVVVVHCIPQPAIASGFVW
jgi:hypothetical protein